MALHPSPILLWAGGPISRNFRANSFPYRASSHFLYFAGQPLMNAVLALDDGQVTLYWDEPPSSAALWHGATPTANEIAIAFQVENVLPLSALSHWSDKKFATIRSQDIQSRMMQKELGFKFSKSIQDEEKNLAEAIIHLRLNHDEDAIAEIKKAIAVTVKGHHAGMKATSPLGSEAQVRAAIESTFMAHHMSSAYGSIVTTHGEVLHNQTYPHPFQSGDLLLVDAGAETELGWAADVTRTWPVSGKFSSTQKDIYDVVLAAHDACIDAMMPGIEYRDIHLLGSKIIAEGLKSLGILTGTIENLLELNIQSYFFPHGIGHVLGLDVHDMEDLGDLAGYASGRVRSDRMGLEFLRLDRPLQENMVVTIEPGFYQIPGLLKQLEEHPQKKSCINWDQLSTFEDVRGIRIEDDIQVTSTGSLCLTKALPTESEKILELIQSN